MGGQFEALVSRALTLMDNGQPEEALNLARQAEEFASSTSNEVSTLQAWNNLGTIFIRIGYIDSAEHAYSIAAAGNETAGDVDLRSNLCNNFGQVYHRSGRLTEAREQLAQAVAIREDREPGTRRLAVALDNLGAVERARGNLDEALIHHEEALAIFKRTGGHLDSHVATAIGNLGGFYEEHRDFKRAEAYRLRAFYTHLRNSGPLASGTLTNAQELCALYLKLGRSRDVDWLVNFLLSTGEREGEQSYRFLAEMLLLLAQKTFARHQLDLTGRLGRRAVQLLELSEGADAPATLGARFQLATTQLALSNADDAQAEFTLLLDRYSQLDDTHNALRTSIELAKAYREKGGMQAARTLLENTICQMATNEVDDRALHASALGNLAEVAHQENHNEEARDLFNAALETLEDNTEEDWPWLIHGLARVEYHLGSYTQAAKHYQDAKSRWTRNHGAGHPFVATCAANLALVNWSIGAADDALDSFEESIVSRDASLRRQLALGSERQRLEFAGEYQADLSKVISFCMSQDNPHERLATFTANVMLQRKVRVLDGLVHTLRQARANPSEAVALLLTRLQVVRSEIAELCMPGDILPARADDIPQQTAADVLDRLRKEEEQLETALSHEGALSEQGIRNASIESIRATLPEDSALIEYVRYRRFEPLRDGLTPWRELRYAALVTAKHEPPRWFDLGAEEDIDSHINKLRQLIAFPATVKAIHGEAEKLTRLLLTPVSQALNDKSHWLVAPDGLINLAPFDVMLDAWKGLEDSPLLTFLVTGRDLLPDEGAQTGKGVTIIAAPDFATAASRHTSSPTAPLQQRSGFAPLPGTLQEANRVREIFPDARMVTGSNATAGFMTEIKAPLILHVATHGVFEPLREPNVSWTTDIVSMLDAVALLSHPKTEVLDPMLYSGLVFAGANTGNGAGSRAILSAREISGIDLQGTQLVVLSACETGVGHIRDGEEFSGLRRAFAIAGAASQLTSLWAVDDEATAELMSTFYERLRAGDSRAQALRHAELHIKQSADHPDWAHPEYWAAFELAGSWAPLAAG